MKATEARSLSLKNVPVVVTQPTLDLVYLKIEEAAKKGLREVYDPYYGIPNLSTAVTDAVTKQLKKDGYKVVYHEGCDDGPNMSSDGYEVISW